ncbi:DUF6993 domain-containing protein [Microbacterium sp. JZ31]|uniref:DUF6993 domain-containing protein n=1 Tax=Microbacterium sp. JZ31 TaxID=1906274 RepID=UPI001EE40C45|nr:hypothetical protein [Microbacterium sp. JZ31]
MSLRRDPRPLRARAAVAVLAIAALTLLSGCAGDEPRPDPTRTTATASAPTASPSEQPVALVPEGSAADNLPIFTQVTERVWASDRRAEGRAYVDALVEAGFDKAAMQVTRDVSTVGNPAESMQFSVLWRGECLVGQVGPDIGEAVTRVLPALEDGTLCLLGATRPIDW